MYIEDNFNSLYSKKNVLANIIYLVVINLERVRTLWIK